MTRKGGYSARPAAQAPRWQREAEGALATETKAWDTLTLMTDRPEVGISPEAWETYEAAAAAHEQGALERAARLYEQAGQEGHPDAAYQLGLVQKDAGRLDDAAAAYRRALDRKDPAAAHNLANLLADHFKHPAEAVELYQLAAEEGDVKFCHGLLLLEQGDTAQAERLIRSSIEQGHAPGHVALGWLFEKTGRPQEALDEYERAIAGQASSAWRQLGLLLSKMGQRRQAEAAFRRGIDDGALENYLDLAHLLEQEDRLDEAEAVFQEALEGGFRDALLAYGNLLSELEGREADAEKVYRRAIDKGKHLAHLNLGILLMDDLGRPADAEAEFKRALEAGDSTAHHPYGVLLRDQGRLDEAEQHLESALDARASAGNELWKSTSDSVDKRKPQQCASCSALPTRGAMDREDVDREALLAESTRLMEAGDTAAHVELLRSALRLFDDDVDILTRLGTELHDSSPQEAQQLIGRAAALANDDPDLLTSCALLMFDLDDPRQAQHYANRVRELAPEGDFALAPSLMLLMGKLALRADRPDLAEKPFRLAFLGDPEMPGHGRVLATFLAETGRPDEALQVAEAALRVRPNDDALESLRDELLDRPAGNRSRCRCSALDGACA